MKALSGLKVLDLGHYIAGPFCTKLLAGLGAETIKVENPKGGDPARKIPPFFKDKPHIEGSGLFLYLNTNKKSITLNLKSATGIKIIKELAKWADILVENFSPRVMPGFGLDYSSLEEINSRLVMASISNFGQTGPYRNYKASDIVEYALGGVMYMSGEPDRAPLKHVGSQAQYQAGLNAFVASLAAAYMAKETGIGQQVDVSIMEVLNSIDEYGLITWEYQKQVYRRRGNIGGQHPWGLFPCKDGFIGIVVSGASAWARFIEMTGLSELTDEKFATAKSRIDHRDELDAILIPWLLEHTKKELYHTGQLKRIAMSFPRTIKDLIDSPQHKARGFWVDIDHPITGRLTYPGAPGIMSETPYQVERAPLFGEHNEEIYSGLLGFGKRDLVRLAGAGVI
jgi:CoA:oxalate CoA-transferase